MLVYSIHTRGNTNKAVERKYVCIKEQERPREEKFVLVFERNQIY